MISFLLIGLLVLGLLLSAFFSSAEIAFTSVNKQRLEREFEKGQSHLKATLSIAQDYDHYSSALLLGNGLVNIMVSSVAALIAVQGLAPLLGEFSRYATLMVGVIIFFVIVILGEIIPKTYAKNHAYALAVSLTLPVRIVFVLLYPIVFIFQSLLLPLKKVLKANQETYDRLSDDELSTMVDTIEADGLIDEKQGDRIRSAIEFSHTKVFEIMTPRVDIYGFDLHSSTKDLLTHPDTFSYSRIPVYEDNLDKVVGILQTKKLYPYIKSNNVIDIVSLLKEPLFVPRTLPIQDLLLMFKLKQRQMAIVVDEHGGTEGLITFEDIVEELVGEIWDETDDVEESIVKQSDHEFLVDGSLNIDDFFDHFDLKASDSSDFATVGGWVLDQLGQFGKVGDTFTYHHLTVIVIEVGRFTIEKIKVIQS
jgi:putative hemolysin